VQARILGVEVVLSDVPGSHGLAAIVKEMQDDSYRLAGIPFSPGDVVVDIGANVGAFAIAVAKRHPGVHVHAFEPLPDTFAQLQRNIAANGVSNVTAWNLAVTGDGREVVLFNDAANSGGSTMHGGGEPIRCPSTTLAAIFRDHVPGRCALLKVDCEGAEYEMLADAPELARVDHLRGEFHMYPHMRAQGMKMSSLVMACARHVPVERMEIVGLELKEQDGTIGWFSYDLVALYRRYLAAGGKPA
jgi:FkbM family methyltransferase